MSPFDLPPGFTTRLATHADVERITALIAASEIANDGASEIHASDVEQILAEAGADGAILVEDGDGAVAWGSLAHGRAEVAIHPRGRGRRIGTIILAWAEALQRARGGGRIRQTVSDGDRAAAAFFTAHGYSRAHTSWILEIPLGDEPPTVRVPDGIEFRRYAPSDAEPAFRLIEDAFNEWPGREPSSFERWSALVLEHASFAPGMSWLAFDGEELVGAVISFDYDGADEGWAQQVATKATHRNRGIARGLLLAVFADFHRSGRRMVGLSTDSRTGALTLYEHLGMRIRRSYTGWTKDLV